jgi:hypothetical protein
MADGSRQADVDPQFEKQIRALRAAAALASGPGDMQSGNWQKAQWMIPDGWAGDPADLAAFSPPFDRSVSNDAFLAAVSNGQAPGVVGDCVIASTQIDYLACLERSFRIRQTMDRPRAFAHAMARQTGLGNESGTYTQDLEYVRSLVKEASLTGS